MAGKLLLSFAKPDSEFVARLRSDLGRSETEVLALELGRGFASSSILSEFDRFEMLGVVLTPSYVRSPWAIHLIQLGIARELRKGKVYLVPLLKEDHNPVRELEGKAPIDFRTDYDRGLSKLEDLFERKRVPEAVSERGRLQPGQRSSDSLPKSVEVEVKRKESLFLSTRPDQPVIRAVPKRKRSCFVAMPFGTKELDEVYRVVKNVVEKKCKLQCIRGDDAFGSRVVMNDVRTGIANATLMIADLTGRNANVTYEVGIAHALGKEVLLMADSMDNVPFDLRHLRVHLYEYSFGGRSDLEDAILKNVRAILKQIPGE